MHSTLQLWKCEAQVFALYHVTLTLSHKGAAAPGCRLFGIQAILLRRWNWNDIQKYGSGYSQLYGVVCAAQQRSRNSVVLAPDPQDMDRYGPNAEEILLFSIFRLRFRKCRGGLGFSHIRSSLSCSGHVPYFMQPVPTHFRPVFLNQWAPVTLAVLSETWRHSATKEIWCLGPKLCLKNDPKISKTFVFH